MIYLVEINGKVSSVGYTSIERAQEFIESRIGNAMGTVVDRISPMLYQFNNREDKFTVAKILEIQIEK